MALLWMILPVLAGYAIVASLLPRIEAPRWTVHLLRASLGVGLGIGLASLLNFLLLMSGIQSATLMMAIELLVTAAAFALSWKSLRVSPINAPHFRWNWILIAIFAVQLALAIAAYLDFNAVNQHGDWDAWSISNVRAKFMAAPGDAWRMAFSPLLENTHPEYPLLLSGSIGRVWRYTGETGTTVPIAMGLLFLIGTAGVLASTLGALGSRTLGLVAAIILLGTPAFLISSSIQYADVPIAFYFLAATALASLCIAHPENPGRFAALAGTFAALAAWTKNEGLLFFCILLLVLTASAVRRLQSAGLYLAGSAPVIAIVLWFKWFLAPPEKIVGNVSNLSPVAKIGDFHRWTQIAGAFGAETMNLGNLLTHPLVLLAIAIATLRLTQDPNRRRSGMAVVVVVALMLAGYFGVFLITPFDLKWHLGTALSRLLIQVWPVAIFAIISLLTDVGEPRP